MPGSTGIALVKAARAAVGVQAQIDRLDWLVAHDPDAAPRARQAIIALADAQAACGEIIRDLAARRVAE